MRSITFSFFDIGVVVTATMSMVKRVVLRVDAAYNSVLNFKSLSEAL